MERLEARVLLAGDFLTGLDPTVDLPDGFGPLMNGRELPGADYDHNSPASMPESESSLLPPAQTQYSMGQKSQLFIRATFLDRGFDPADDYSEAALRARMAEIDAFHIANSYDLISYPDSLFEVVPGTVTMPYTVAEINLVANFSHTVHQAARLEVQELIDAGTLTLSQPVNDFDTITVLFPNIHDTGAANWGGLGSKPGQYVWLHDTISTGIWAHELGHNMGAGHGDFWEPTDATAVISPPGAGTQYEYGNHLDLMGSGDLGDDFGAYWKGRLGWLTEGVQLVDVVADGVYTLHALDEAAAAADRHYGLRVERNAGQEYWLEHRATSDDPLANNGLILNVRNLSGDGEPALIDMSPDGIQGNYTEDRIDAPLPLGRMVSDWDADLHITALTRNVETGNDSIDVAVQHGPFPGNQPPTGSLRADVVSTAVGHMVQFTAEVNEPDGDPTAIAWDFGDGQTGYGTLAIQHAWATSGQYPVRLSVADTKGSATERIEIIDVGAVDQRIARYTDLETTANTTTTGDQNEPAIASNGDDRFVVVWQSEGQDGSGWGIYAQRFLADGQKVGGEIRVNAVTAGNQESPDVAMDASGNFVVVWQGDGNDQQEIFARCFDWNGNASGDQFQVNTNEHSSQIEPAIAVRPGTGDFVVAWSSWVFERDVRFRRFAADGTALDAVEQVAGGGRNWSQVDVAMNAAGDFVLVWDDGADAASSEVFAQKFLADGSEAVAPFQVNAQADDMQQDPRVAIDSDGGFAVAWETEVDGEDLKSGWIRSFHADGSARSGDVALSEQPDVGLANPTIVIDQQSRRIVAWRGGRENYSSASDGDVGLRVFDADGDGLTSETTLDSQYTQWFTGPDLAVLDSPTGFALANPSRESGDVNIRTHFFGIPDRPSLQADFVQTEVATAVGVPVLSNDSGIGTGFSISIHSPPLHGSAVVNNNGTPADPADDFVSYTPHGQFTGVDSFVYAVGFGETAGFLQVASVQVGTWDNVSPTAVDDAFVLLQDRPLLIGVPQLLENDTDTDGGQIQWTGFTQPAHGTVTSLDAGSLLYQPEAGYAGADTFTYSIDDAQGGSAVGTVTIDVQASTDGLAPGDLLVYYGWPTSLNGTYSVDGAAAEFGQYDYVVLGAGLEFPAHGDHANTAAILSHAATTETQFFGYIDLGVTTNGFTMQEIQQRVDLWRDLGVDGIFFDDFGYDFQTPRARQNEAVHYAHQWGLPVVANGFFVDEVLGDQIHAVHNPAGESTSLTAADYYLYESYQIVVGQYVDEATWQDKAGKLEGYRESLGIQVLALTTAADGAAFDQAQLDYAWNSALLYGYAGFGWGEYDFASGDGLAPFRSRPQPVLGSRFLGNVTDASPEYYRDTDLGRITVNAATHTTDYRLDTDGVDAAIEDGAPNGGDGNLDGIDDSRQSHVVSLPAAQGGAYFTLVTEPESRFESVAAVANPSPGDAPADVDFPAGWFNFTLADLGPDGKATVTMLWEPGPAPNAYYRYGPTPENPTPHWYPFLYDGLTGAVIYADRIVLHFADGQRGDDDLTVDGRVVDAGGPARVANPWQNPISRYDVDGNGVVAPLDALTLINDINANQARPLPATLAGADRIPAFLDVDGSHGLEPNDVLQVINFLNGQ